MDEHVGMKLKEIHDLKVLAVEQSKHRQRNLQQISDFNASQRLIPIIPDLLVPVQPVDTPVFDPPPVTGRYSPGTQSTASRRYNTTTSRGVLVILHN